MEEMSGDVMMNNNHDPLIDYTIPDNTELKKCEIAININADNTSKKTRRSKNKGNLENNNDNEDNNLQDEEHSLIKENQEKGKTRFPLNKIKNIMKLDENIKLCQKDVYNLLGKATEMFLHELARNSYNITTLNKRKTMNIEDISAAVKRVDRYSFINLKSILDENLFEEINKKEEKIEHKINASKEKSIEKIKDSKEKKVKSTSTKPKPQSILFQERNRKIDAYFQKNQQ